MSSSRFLGCALAAVLVVVLGSTLSRADGEADFLAGKTKSCAACALEKAQLKRRDLAGVDLSGAKLARAVFHRSKLIGTNFAGADLGGANLNKTDLKNASFSNPTILVGLIEWADKILTE